MLNFENVLTKVAKEIIFTKDDVRAAIQSITPDKAVAILYASNGIQYLAIGKRKHSTTLGESFIVQEVRTKYGTTDKLTGYDALAITSTFIGIKVLVSGGRVYNEVITSRSFFTNDVVLTETMHYVRAIN